MWTIQMQGDSEGGGLYYDTTEHQWKERFPAQEGDEPILFGNRPTALKYMGRIKPFQLLQIAEVKGVTT